VLTRLEIDGFKTFRDFALDVPPFMVVLCRNASRLVDGVKKWWDSSRKVKRLTGKCNSFVPGTKVLTADGSTKPIEEVEPADLGARHRPGDRPLRTQLVAATIMAAAVPSL
jgi:hypothetical protein